MATARANSDGRRRNKEVLTSCCSRRGLAVPSRQALTPIVGNGAVDDRAAIDAFPGVENQKEVGETLKHHEPFALRTFHRILPGYDVHSCAGFKQKLHQLVRVRNFNTLAVTYLSPSGL